ncbi:MAG TPA: histidine phosphatase family protein [Gammaproteobacteria bacterium]|jgi:phosphohistidine phosphatase
MKQLTLLRHAKSSWDDSRLADQDRPLARRGLRDAPRMGERLAKRGLRPDLMLTSSATRARETAELVNAQLNDAPIALRIEPKIYLATPGELLAVIASVEDAVGSLVVIGHNPGFTQLANMLLPDLELLNLPTAGVVCIECDIPSWGEIDAGSRRLEFYDFPKNPEPA